MAEPLKLYVTLAESIYLLLLSNDTTATLKHFPEMNSRLGEENCKICNPAHAFLRYAIQFFFTRLDGRTITSICDVDRIDLSTLVIK